MTGILIDYAVYSAEVFYMPGATSITVPDKAVSGTFYIQAAGGASGERDEIEGSGGGGGGFSIITRNVLSGEWGTNLTCTVGAGAVATNGGNTTLSGTLNGSAINITCNGGQKGQNFFDGIGGSATGGDTNIAGQSGYGFVAAPFDERAPGFGGKAGGDGQAGAVYGTPFSPGDGADGRLLGEGIAGASGYIKIWWSF
jgi:hypothetical protein